MKLKTCKHCGQQKPIWKSDGRDKYCKDCWYKINKNKGKLKGRSTIKTRPKKTGELQLFLKIYADRKGICEITGKQLEFSPMCFAHILSKGAYPGFRLNPDNIIMVDPEIHALYDNSSKEKLLEKYPGAIIIYNKKLKLKRDYYD